MVKNKKKSDSEDEPCNNPNCKKLSETVQTLTESVNTLLDRVKSLEASLETALSALNKKDNSDNSDDTFSHSAVLKRMHSIEELLEERTNRQLRKTLVFRGVKQDTSERSWKDCEEVLAKVIASTLDIDSKIAINMIDRCHRGGNPEYFKKENKPRPIYAAMHEWKVCEDVIFQARRKRTIFVDYKYGPLTTKRRNLALKRRRELINAGAITQGHVAYPARLMGKGKDDVRYREIENFSNVDVRGSK